MNFAKNLTRDEMKNIMAGSGPCQIAWRNADGSFAGYGMNSVSVFNAQNWYAETYTNSSGQYVSGYCCASCGGPGFENAL